MWTGTGSAESNVDCGLQLGWYVPYTCCLAWYDTKLGLLQKLLRTLFCKWTHLLQSGLLCYMAMFVATLPAQLQICSEDWIGKLWNICHIHYIWIIHICTWCVMEYCKYFKSEIVKQNFEIISNKPNIYRTYWHKFH